MARILLDDLCEKLSLKLDVENMRKSRGNDADALLKDLHGGIPDSKKPDFSEEPHKNPPHMSGQKYNWGLTLGTFPPIHSAHHNKKSIFSSYPGKISVKPDVVV